MKALIQEEGAQSMEPAMALALAANFGGVDRWRDEFIALGRAFGGGAGCLALVFQPARGTLVHRWAVDAEHAASDGVPVVLFAFDARADLAQRRAALEHFVHAIDWAAVYARYQEAVHAASEGFGAAQDEVAGASLLLDVRRAGVFEQAASIIPGACWRDPAQVARWGSELPAGHEVIVYCVYGHEVGRATALRLRAAGVNARYLHGGIDGWQAAGRALAPKA